MFIQQTVNKHELVYVIRDDKQLLLHYFQQELDNLKLQSPCSVLVYLDYNDRRGYRSKLYKLFRKLNKLTIYSLLLIPTERANNEGKLIDIRFFDKINK